MQIDQAFFAHWTPRVQAVLRIVSAFLFLQHATAKFFAVPHVAFFDNLKLFSLIGAAGTIELIGGTLLLIGLWGRAAAFLLSGEMAFAYFMAHAPNGHVLSPMLNDGEPAVLYCFVFLFLSVAGPGPWSIDSARGAVKA
jgi:putative oxidoreductase